MRYVRFWRGNADDFARITHKNEDTMYFVIQPDTNSFTMYLGATELLSGDDLNSSSIDALEDVIISKKLYDRQVLMYDALQECWVNASLDKAAGAYVGPTAEYMGLPGMLPGAPAGSENLFFRSDGKWVEQHIEKVENIDKLQHVELIANITAQWSEVNKNDLIIIEDILFNNLKNDIAYWYDGKEWLSLANSSIPSDYAENDPQAPSYILNRPFYSEMITEPLEIAWDGVWGGRPYFVQQQNGFVGTCMVKVSDEFFDAEQLRSGYIALSGIRDEVIPISELNIHTTKIGNAITHSVTLEDVALLVSVSENVSIEGIQVEEGIYFFSFSYLDENDTDILQRVHVSSLSFPAVTHTKYHKLDNNFVDAEWMATESTGVGTKKFSLSRASDAFVLGRVVNNQPLIRLDSRIYTEEELLGARLIVTLEGVDFSWVAVRTEVAEGNIIAAMEGIGGTVRLISCPLNQDFSEGLYLSVEEFDMDFSRASATLEIFNVTNQVISNKLPNKFLDLDWIPKTEMMQEWIYEGSISGHSSFELPNNPQLLDLDTVLLFHVGDDVREVRGAGVQFPVGMVGYKYTLPNGGYIVISVDTYDGTQMEFSVESETYVTITRLKRVPNPMPSYFLPDGVGSAAIVTINHSIEDGIRGYETEISEAWNGGGRVILQFTDISLTLLSFYYLPLDGVVATAITAEGRVYLFDPLERGNGWALNIRDLIDNPASVLYKAEGSEEFVPTPLNSTLTEGSTLPAQEGAVFTAIQEIKNLITPINEALEAALEGGN